jgi:DNA-binding HxlR family transcriptional regulator
VGEDAHTDGVVARPRTGHDVDLQSFEIALELLRKKWAIPLLCELDRGPRRRHQLVSALHVRNEPLDATIQMMRRWGAIDRTLIPCGQTDGNGYAITPIGRELLDAVARLAEWQLQNLPELLANDREWKALHDLGQR